MHTPPDDAASFYLRYKVGDTVRILSGEAHGRIGAVSSINLGPTTYYRVRFDNQSYTDVGAYQLVGASAPPALLAGVRRALADRLHISEDAIRVVQREGVGWPDSGFGCKDYGGLYLGAEEMGYRIVLQAQGSRFTYHTSEGHRHYRVAGGAGWYFVVLCVAGHPPKMHDQDKSAYKVVDFRGQVFESLAHFEVAYRRRD